MEKTTTNSHSNSVYVVHAFMEASEHINKRGFIRELFEWVFKYEYEELYAVQYKFLINEDYTIRAGTIIVTTDGKRWYVKGRSVNALVVEAVEPMTLSEIDKMDRYAGRATVFSNSIPPDSL